MYEGSRQTGTGGVGATAYGTPMRKRCCRMVVANLFSRDSGSRGMNAVGLQGRSPWNRLGMELSVVAQRGQIPRWVPILWSLPR
jgi:hypothetical protein